MRYKTTLKMLLVLVEIAAVLRCGVATYTVAFDATNDLFYSLFTVIVIEGVFLSALFMLDSEAVAPLAALLALAFSGLMQYYELGVVAHTITEAERQTLRYALAFAPVVILALAFLRRIVSVASLVETAERMTERLPGRAVSPPSVEHASVPSPVVPSANGKPYDNPDESPKA